LLHACRDLLNLNFLSLAVQDGNHDGVFTVEELIKWIEKNKLVKFVEEGRDVDMERMMASQSTSDHQKEEDKEAAKALKGEAASGKGTA